MGALGPVGIAVLSTDKTERSVGFMVAGSMARSWRLGNWIADAKAPVEAKAMRMEMDFIVVWRCAVWG